MWKPHFGPVDGAIAGALDDGQDIVVSRIEDDALGGGLCRNLSELGFSMVRARSREVGSHLEALERARHGASAILGERTMRGGVGSSRCAGARGNWGFRALPHWNADSSIAQRVADPERSCRLD